MRVTGGAGIADLLPGGLVSLASRGTFFFAAPSSSSSQQQQHHLSAEGGGGYETAILSRCLPSSAGVFSRCVTHLGHPFVSGCRPSGKANIAAAEGDAVSTVVVGSLPYLLAHFDSPTPLSV
jgi:hypothetical protein